MIRTLAASALTVLALATPAIPAGGGDGHIEDVDFSFEGPFGTYDQMQLQRGLQVFTESCSGCHGLRQVPIRTLHDAGGPGLKVFEGSGGIALLDSYRRGIFGTMPGTEIVWAIRAEWDALEAGDLARATELQGLIAPLISLQQGLDGYLSVEKMLLQRQGVFPNRVIRGPVGFTLDPETEDEATRLFDLLCKACGRRPIT